MIHEKYLMYEDNVPSTIGYFIGFLVAVSVKIHLHFAFISMWNSIHNDIADLVNQKNSQTTERFLSYRVIDLEN